MCVCVLAGGAFHRKNDDQPSLEELIFEIATKTSNDKDNDITLNAVVEASDQFNSILVKDSGRYIRYFANQRN